MQVEFGVCMNLRGLLAARVSRISHAARGQAMGRAALLGVPAYRGSPAAGAPALCFSQSKRGTKSGLC